MAGLEKGEANQRDQSMHPLWEEYRFKKEQENVGGTIEIDLDEDESEQAPVDDSGATFYFKQVKDAGTGFELVAHAYFVAVLMTAISVSPSPRPTTEPGAESWRILWVSCNCF
jgi:hypothetical protein